MFAYSEGARFTEALRSALEDQEVSERIRSALRAVSSARDGGDPVDALERRLWSMLPGIRAGRANERAVLDVALRIVSG